MSIMSIKPIEFRIYLMLGSVSADLKITDKEIKLIKKHINAIYSLDDNEFTEVFDKVSAKFESHNDYEAMLFTENCIKELKLDQVQKNNLYEELVSLLADLHTDSHESTETIYLMKLKKLLSIKD